MTTRHAAVVGVGLMGGSAAAALRRDGVRVSGFDIVEGRAQRAVQLGLIDRAAPSLVKAVEDAEVVILATPVSSAVDLLPAVDHAAPPEAMILDLGSVKRPIVRRMDCLAGAQRCVGGHPMAGTERSGPDAADSALFQGMPFILTPCRGTSQDTQTRAWALASQLGGRPIWMGAAEHDKIVASVSHLPQVISSLLAARVEPGWAELAGPGLGGMVRLAASDWSLWKDILTSNADNVGRAIDDFVRDLQSLGTWLASGDLSSVGAVMEDGRKRVASMRESGRA